MNLNTIVKVHATPSWHLHETVTQLDIFLFVEEGELLYIVNHLPFYLTKGDILYIPKGSLRIAKSNSENNHYAVLFNEIDNMLSISLLDRDQCVHFKCQNYDYVKQRISILYQQWISLLPHYRTRCLGIFIELLGIADQTLENAAIPTKKLLIVTEIQQYILQNYREPIKIEQLAELVHRSPNYVTQVFRGITGQTPIAYLHQVRITSSLDLLLDTNLTISQVAEITGFCDHSYFNRIFKKIMGYPPSSHLKSKLYRKRPD